MKKILRYIAIALSYFFFSICALAIYESITSSETIYIAIAILMYLPIALFFRWISRRLRI